MKSYKLLIHCINKKKLPKKYTTTQLNQYKYKVDTIFMNSEDSQTYKPQVLMLELTDKIDL